MKRIIFGSALLISGIIGIVGILISLTIKFPDGTGPILSYMGHPYAGLTILFFIFIIMAVAGIIIGISDIVKDSKK